jgi:hypothetical protein
MKKLFPLALIAVAAMTFTSCKKDYTCKCTYNLAGVNTEAGSFTIHDTKSNAKSNCDGKSATYSTLVGVSCAIQ